MTNPRNQRSRQFGASDRLAGVLGPEFDDARSSPGSEQLARQHPSVQRRTQSSGDGHPVHRFVRNKCTESGSLLAPEKVLKVAFRMHVCMQGS